MVKIPEIRRTKFIIPGNWLIMRYNGKEENMKRIFTKSQLIITGVIAFYLLGSVMMNILTMKTIQIGNISIFTCGIVMTPLVFACNDILTECTGKRFAFKVILVGAGVNLIWSLLCAFTIALPGNNPYIADCYKTILGSTWRITASSIVAYIGSGYLNNVIMAGMKEHDGEKRYYARAIISTAFGQLFDDYVFCFLAFAPFGISAIENPWKAIITIPIMSAIAETIIEAVFTPLSKKICDDVKRYRLQGE